MATTFSIKKGDTRPIFQAALTDDGVAYDLTGATPRLIVVLKDGATVLVNRETMTIVGDPTAGTVSYDFTGKTGTAATYLLEIEVTDSAGEILTFPGTTFITMTVYADLG